MEQVGWSKLLGRQWVVAFGLLAFGAIYSTQFLALPSRWWFEDDPTLFAYASTIHNPASIFTDPAVLRHSTSAAALVPMQLLSYWVDVRIAGFSPQFAYAHQVCSFLLTLLLFYLILAHYLPEDTVAALIGSVIWALLPSTAVVVQFLATRHYLEGLLFSALSLYLADCLSAGEGRLGSWRQGAVVSCGAVGMLYKEVYAPVVPILLLVIAWKRRDRRLMALTVAMTLGYGLYRLWVLGSGLRYVDMPFLTPSQYLKFLSKLPYTFSSTYGGYFLFGSIAALCVYAMLGRKARLETVLCFLGILAVSLVVIFPTSYPLYGTIRRPDPWYRIVFLLNTMIAGFSTWLAVRCLRPRLQATLALLALAVLLPGILKTRGLWTELTASAEREGKFYLSNPGKMLLSEQEASWFIPGLNRMYDVHPPHYVLSENLATTLLEPGVVLWRFTDGHFAPDPAVRPALSNLHSHPGNRRSDP
ncbi:MAG: hypothetical protein NTY38_20005 [Acidobacteria bacterium]|nr:hypothetical protein [Acidobacteriota bacterium]